MTDFIAYDPEGFPIQELIAAARGDSVVLAPGVAAELLAAKVDPAAREALARLIEEPAADPRGRSAAIRLLAHTPDLLPVLRRLESDKSSLVAESARQALAEQDGER